MKSRTFLLLSLLIVFALVLSACASATPVLTQALAPTEAPTQGAVVPVNQNLILATTTSTQDSGLLDVLIPLFETETGYKVQTVAVGSGQALKMGEDGNADVLLVHAPASEATFMEAGFGKDRALIMHNDFIVAGPSADPAGVKGLPVLEAFKTISDKSATFVSRGDDSGTNKAELSLWKKA